MRFPGAGDERPLRWSKGTCCRLLLFRVGEAAERRAVALRTGGDVSRPVEVKDFTATLALERSHRRDLLFRYTNLPPTPLEQLESVDMMRLLEHGYTVKMVPTEFNTQAVDTEADLARVARLMKNDPLLSRY